MKKILIASVITLFAFSVNAQTAEYYRTLNVLKDYDYTVAENKYADISQGQTTYMYRTFFEGTTYVIYGFSDDSDVKDLDLSVYYEDGTLFKQDVLVDASPYITFTPSYTRRMKVALKNYKSDDPYYESRCRFFVAYK